MRTVDLWWLLRRRSADERDPQGLTNVLAVIAFATTTAILLVVVGGFGAFLGRAGGIEGMQEAWTRPSRRTTRSTRSSPASPRSCCSSRSSRSVGRPRGSPSRAATRAWRRSGSRGHDRPGHVAHGARRRRPGRHGALVGLVGYGALLPLVAQLRFQGRTFDLGELWVGVPALLGAVVLVVAVALVSALVSLRRVAITPLGVAARVTPRASRRCACSRPGSRPSR